MNQACPQCFSQLASSEVGNLCVNCGYLQRRHHNHAPIQDEDMGGPQEQNRLPADHVLPGSFEAPRGLDELLFRDDPESHTEDTPKDPSPPPTTLEKPQIINHRASSQYRRRLERRMETLAVPEIESPLEPDSSLEAGETKNAPPTMPVATEATAIPSQAPTSDKNERLDEEEGVIEVNEPHRPSPYLLNMGEAEPETSASHRPEYRSPLESPVITPTSKDPAHHQTSKPQSDTPTAEVAMARADALLAAAGSDKSSAPSKTNYIIIAVTIMLLLGIGSFLAFTLLRRPAAQTNTLASPTNQPTTSQNTSPTPTNLTESAKRDAERKDTLNTIAIALAAYKKANGTYPSGNDIEVLSALTSSNPPYLREIKTDPLSNAENGVVIKYGYTSDGAKFTLTASLENKQDSDAVNGLYVVKSP